MKNIFPATTAARVYTVFLIFLAIAPLIFRWIDQPFYLDLLSRALILAIAAISLNLILGYGGMVSLGHAAYIGIGAYCVGIPAYYDYYSGWLHLGLTIVVTLPRQHPLLLQQHPQRLHQLNLQQHPRHFRLQQHRR